MLDGFLIDKDEGFPDHPHYGFESVTYMLEYLKQHNGAYNNQIAEFVAEFLSTDRRVSKAAMEEAPEWTNLVMDQALRRPDKLSYSKTGTIDVTEYPFDFSASVESKDTGTAIAEYWSFTQDQRYSHRAVADQL
ncbi:hypothetical protein K457DRAFT_1896859 [Linnemannia elongata AG-77]|uniref:Uncharacterized protein n=1 Tax=Linnemannia elongata AG-77 TaxID=1314771 RepID=A0A197JLX8_9FUNG|nr:hypothetical protein K457DRAFT_1896859 [Linnemannia elongata AG-77]